MKSHMKRLNMPKSWKVLRKTTKFILNPRPGAHSLEQGMPLGVIMRDYLGHAETMHEARIILRSKPILVDGKRRTDPKFLVGLMDAIAIPETKEYYRMILSNSGHLEAVKTTEKDAMLKPKKITGKKNMGQGMQLNFFDGTNMLVKAAEQKVGDTLLIEFPGKISQHFKLAPGAMIYLTGGKHVGNTGTIESVEQGGILYKSKSGKILAQKKHVFVIGEKTASIQIR